MVQERLTTFVGPCKSSEVILAPSLYQPGKWLVYGQTNWLSGLDTDIVHDPTTYDNALEQYRNLIQEYNEGVMP